MDKLTIPKIKAILDERGISYPSKAKKDDLLKLLNAEIKPVSVEMPQAPMPAAAAAGPRTTGPRVLSAAKASRLMVIVQDESESEINYFCLGHDDETCQNYVFEKSSGTSNDYNFRGTFLPFLRQDGTWLNKDAGLDDQCGIIIYKMVYDILKKEGHRNECLKEAFVFVFEFLERFGCWKQIQYSAALSREGDDSIWTETRVGQILKEIVTNFNWYSINNDRNKLEEYVKKSKELPSIDKERLRRNMEAGTKFKTLVADRIYVPEFSKSEAEFFFKNLDFIWFPEKISSDELRAKVRSFEVNGKPMTGPYTRSQKGLGFLYRRLAPIGDISFDESRVPEISRTEDSVNSWLRDNNALCDIKPQTRESKKVDDATAAEKSLATKLLDKPGYFSGWIKSCK